MMRVCGQRARICATMRAISSSAPAAASMLAGRSLAASRCTAAEHVQRQIAVAVVIAVEEAPLLMPVQRIVGGVEIEDDLLRRPSCAPPGTASRTVARSPPDHARSCDSASTRSRLSSSRLSVDLPATGAQFRSRRFQLAGQHRHHRIVPQLVVIVEVLVAERDPEHPLTDQGRYLMLDQLRSATIDEARGKAIDQPDRPVGRSQQQRPGVRRDRAAIKSRHNPRVLRRVQTRTVPRSAYTLSASGRSSNHSKVVAAQQLSLIRSPDAPI